jgi:hypothetical protein
MQRSSRSNGKRDNQQLNTRLHGLSSCPQIWGTIKSARTVSWRAEKTGRGYFS